jgi:hypothetical protein
MAGDTRPAATVTTILTADAANEDVRLIFSDNPGK